MPSICLIVPPSIFLLDERVFTNLGVLKVAASLESAGKKVEVLDLSGVSNFEDVVELHVKNSQCSWFGITTTTPQMPACAKIARKIKITRPDVKLIIGGPHPTLIAAALKRENKMNVVNGRAFIAMEQLRGMFDCIVSGDGEDSIFEALKGESSFIDADDPKGKLFMTNARYEDTPWPARHLVDLDSYRYTIEGHKSTSLIGQLGCPFSCFVPNTKIITSDGNNKKAKDIKVGDTLVALDEQTKELTETTVMKKFVHDAEELYAIEFEDEKLLECTGEHPFYVRGEWIEARNLVVGDEIFQISSDITPLSYNDKIASITKYRKKTKVYNYECSPHNNYFANYVLSHNCGFCGGRESAMLRRIRSRSTKNVLDELEHLHKTYGYTGYMFYDDELNVNKNIVELMDGITDLQSRLGVEFRLRGFVKAELFTEKQAQAMYRAGFRWLLTGFESGSPRILENINKKATRDDNTRCFEIARNNNLKVKALMSIGHPGESLETAEDTRKWLMEVRPDDFDVTIITTYPGTPYYDHAVETSPGIWTYTYEKTGDRLHAVALDYNETADYYKGDPDGGYKAYVFTDFLSSEQLVSLRDDIERSVREKFSIPFNPGAAAMNFEHSMGQTSIPTTILRRTQEVKKVNFKLKVIQ